MRALLLSIALLLSLALPTMAQSPSPSFELNDAQQSYADLQVNWSKAVEDLQAAAAAWQADPLQKTLLEEAVNNAFDVLLDTVVYDCFAHAWGLSYAWILLAATDISNMESPEQLNQPTPNLSALQTLGQFGNIVEVDCSEESPTGAAD